MSELRCPRCAGFGKDPDVSTFEYAPCRICDGSGVVSREQGVASFGKSLDDAMLDAINALPAEDRPAMCDAIRDAMSGAPRYRIVEGEATRA